jgi:predicted HAD superfamily Cof-like phosphohydrolase
MTEFGVSHFIQVCEFNKAFDYNVYDLHNGNPLNNIKDAQYRYDLIHEEGIVELGRAIKLHDITETQDALGDLLYVLYGACYTYNLNPDLIFDSIYGGFNNFNTLIGCEKSYSQNINYYDIVVDGIGKIKKCLLETKNIIELYSILMMVIIDTYKLSTYLLCDINNVFNIIHKSNMSKLCNSEEEAIMTVISYEKKYKQHVELYYKYCDIYGKDSLEATSVYSPYDSPYYYKSNIYWLVKNKSTGKALKSINYTPVVLV